MPPALASTFADSVTAANASLSLRSSGACEPINFIVSTIAPPDEPNLADISKAISPISLSESPVNPVNDDNSSM